MANNLTDKTLTQLGELLEKKQISSVELTTEYLNRIEEKDKAINAFISVNKDYALAAAKESDARRQEGKHRSAYDGIPMAVKDNINVKGLPTTCASKILEGYIAPFNAGAVDKLFDKGFVVLGKTNMDEFAMGSTTETSAFGQTKNPFDLSRVPGGSSGGSAAAVAASMAPVALGSDTGGSIRQPAAFCGVTGVKPTYGRVSRYGLVAFASSLDQIGTFGGTVADAAILLDAICGKDQKDGTSADAPLDFLSGLDGDVSGLKVGVPEEYFDGVSQEIASCVRDKISALEQKGASIKSVSLKCTEYAIPVYYLIATAEASSNLARFDGVRYGRRAAAEHLDDLYLRSRSEGFGDEVKRRIMLGTFALSSGYYDAYYLKALKGRQLIINDFMAALKDVDIIVTPAATSTAFRFGEMAGDPLQMYMSDILTISANLAGLPGISIPAGLSSEGLPIGMQIMSGHFNERALFAAATASEACCEPIAPRL